MSLLCASMWECSYIEYHHAVTISLYKLKHKVLRSHLHLLVLWELHRQALASAVQQLRPRP